MSLTRPLTRGQLFLRIQGLGGKRTAQSVESDGIVDATPFLRSQASYGDYAGALIYRPNVAAIDQIREAGFVDGSKLLQTGLAYADTTDNDYELYYLLHPYIVNECIRLAPHEVYGEVTVPLTLWPDGDLSEALVAHWDNGTIVAPTKSSDSQYKFIGNHRTLVVLTAGANLYAESDDVLVEPGERIFHGAVGALERSSASGVVSYVLWDQTNSVALYTNTFTSYRDQIIRATTTIPEDCYKVSIRIGATTSGITTVWKAFPSHRLNSGTSEVQSWLKEQMNLLGFGPASYHGSTGTDRFNATERVWEQWDSQNGSDYSLMPFVPASESYTLQINRPGGLSADDYWIHGYRRMSDIEEELDDEAATTNIDPEMLLTAVECLVTSKLGDEYRQQYLESQAKLISQRIARPLIQPNREKGVTMIGMRRHR